MKPIGNVTIAVSVPEDFPEHAKQLGYSAESLVWLLAEDLCAQPPSKIERTVVKSPLSNIIPFPEKEEG